MRATSVGRGGKLAKRAIEADAVGAQRFAQEARDYLNHPEWWSWDEVEWLATCCFPNAKALEPTLNRVFDYRRAGARINGGPEDKFTLDGKTLNSYGMQREIKRRCLLGLNEVMGAPLQGHGMWMRFVRGEAKDIAGRFYEDGSSIFTRGHRNGKTIIVWGNRGSGKTTTAYEYILSDCLRAGMYGVGNVHLFPKHKGDDPDGEFADGFSQLHPLGPGPTRFGHAEGVPLYTYSETLSGTVLAICINRLANRSTVRMFDETQQGQMRTRAASHKYQTQKLIWHIERKLWCITVAILQLETDIPTELRGFADLYVFKPSTEDKSLVDITTKGRTEYYKGLKAPRLRHREMEEIDLPVPRIDTDVWGVFLVDINYDELLAFVAEEIRINMSAGNREPISIQQVKALKAYVEKHMAEELIDDKDRAKVYLELRRNLGYSFRDLEDITGWSKSKLQRWDQKLYGSLGQ